MAPTNTGRSPSALTRPKKSLAQHFLVDRRVLGRIVAAAEISPDDVVVEIGPGRGVLTGELAMRAGRVVAVEIDETLATELATRYTDQPTVSIVNADATEIDIDSLIPPDTTYKMVGNLPYNAATYIVRRFLSAPHKPRSMIVMVQKEVALNMVAPPGKMGLLSIAVQLYGKPRVVSYVAPRAFRPAPKVTSAIVDIEVYEQPALEFENEDAFFQVVRAGFSSPRKQVHNCLRQGLSITASTAQSMLLEANIDPMRRPATLTLPEWGFLYNAYRKRPSPEG